MAMAKTKLEIKAPTKSKKTKKPVKRGVRRESKKDKRERMRKAAERCNVKFPKPGTVAKDVMFIGTCELNAGGIGEVLKRGLTFLRSKKEEMASVGVMADTPAMEITLLPAVWENDYENPEDNYSADQVAVLLVPQGAKKNVPGVKFLYSKNLISKLVTINETSKAKDLESITADCILSLEGDMQYYGKTPGAGSPLLAREWGEHYTPAAAWDEEAFRDTDDEDVLSGSQKKAVKAIDKAIKKLQKAKKLITGHSYVDELL